MSKVERKDCVEYLSCVLSEEEVAGYSQEMAVLHQTKLEVEDKKKEVTKDFGARIQKFESDIHVLSRKITTRSEGRDVNCFWEFDYASGEKTLVRTDTGEKIKQETISAIERQRYIEFVDKENKDGEISRAVKKAEEKEVKKKDKKSAKPEKAEEEESPVAKVEPESTDETEESVGQEDAGDGCPIEEPEPSEPEEAPDLTDDDKPEEEDCFATFDSNDAECANCDRKEECYSDTVKSEETPTEEPASEEVEEASSEETESTTFYTCKKCGKGFEEYVDKGDGVWECPHCNSDSWM